MVIISDAMTVSDLFSFYIKKKKLHTILHKDSKSKEYLMFLRCKTHKFSILSGCNVSEEEHIVNGEQMKDSEIKSKIKA